MAKIVEQLKSRKLAYHDGERAARAQKRVGLTMKKDISMEPHRLDRTAAETSPLYLYLRCICHNRGLNDMRMGFDAVVEM